jgi:hypothetical protein
MKELPILIELYFEIKHGKFKIIISKDLIEF